MMNVAVPHREFDDSNLTRQLLDFFVAPERRSD
jgi:hypothetical protein